MGIGELICPTKTEFLPAGTRFREVIHSTKQGRAFSSRNGDIMLYMPHTKTESLSAGTRFCEVISSTRAEGLFSRNGDVVMLYSLQKWSFSQQKHCVSVIPIVHKTKHSGVYLYRLPSPMISIHIQSSEYVYRPTDSLSTETTLLNSVSYHRHHCSK